jgi:PAS domain S-box-containing protein
MTANLLDLLSPRRSIRGRFFLVTAGISLLSIAATVGVGLYLFGAVRQQQVEVRWEESRMEFARELADPAAENLKMATLLARLPAIQEAMRGRDAVRLRAYLGAIVTLGEKPLGISELDLRASDGAMLVHMLVTGSRRDDTEAEMITEVVRTRTQRSGIERRGDGLQVAAAVPVTDPQGEYLGTLAIGSAISNASINAIAPQNTDIALDLLGDNRFQPYAHSNGFLRTLLTDAQRQAAFSGRKTRFSGQDDRRPLQAGAFALEDYGGRAIGIVEAHIDVSDIHAGDSRILPLAAGLVVLLLFDAGLLAIWGGYRLTELFRRLIELMCQFAAGNLSAAVPATNRKDELGQMARAIATLRDGLVKRERIEREYNAIDKRHRLAAETTGIGTWFPDPFSGKLIWSDNCKALLGLPKDVVPNLELLASIVHSEDRAAFLSVLQARANSLETIEHEYRVVWPDGSIHWLQSAGGRAVDDAGRFVGVQGTIVNIDERKRAEAERTILTERLLRFEADERVRLARELHDQIAQNLTGLSLGLKQLEQDNDDEALRANLRRLRSLLADISTHVHQTAGAFHPTSLDDLGFDMALENYIREWSFRTDIHADFHSRGLAEGVLVADLERAVFSLVKDVLDNVARHAQASQVSVVIEATKSELRLVIDDDGEASISDAATRHGQGTLGMSSALERIAAHGGTLDIESNDGSGTARHVRIPLTRKARERT